MNLSRIRLRPDAAQTDTFWKRFTSDYSVHKLVWSWFADSPDRRRDFLYRQEGAEGKLCFFTLSERPPLDRDGLWLVESKPFQPKLSKGQKLAFTTRVNPTLQRGDGPAKGQRCDVVMDAKFRARDSNDPVAAAPGLVQDAVTKWLSARAERCGFSFGSDEVTVDGYHQLRFSKGHGQPDIRITVVDVGGLLTVIDPVRFLDMLRGGLGHAKGFGCGLMLIRRA